MIEPDALAGGAETTHWHSKSRAKWPENGRC